jgi:hypothetical protein
MQLLLPAAVDFAKLAVSIAFRMDFEVLHPQQVQGDADAFELLVDVSYVGLWPRARRSVASTEEPALQSRVVQLFRERPAQTCQPSPLGVRRH